jgi:hypothetical protein
VTDAVRPPHRVLLVREWDQQTTGSGCCGRLEGGESELSDAADFGTTRPDMEAMGAIYRTLRARFAADEVDVQVVDPRNLTYLAPTLVRDARRRGAPWRQTLTELRRGVGQGAIVVDGHVVSTGVIPAPERAVDLVEAELAASR